MIVLREKKMYSKVSMLFVRISNNKKYDLLLVSIYAYDLAVWFFSSSVPTAEKTTQKALVQPDFRAD